MSQYYCFFNIHTLLASGGGGNTYKVNGDRVAAVLS